MPDKMIVIGENGPCFELPIEISRYRKQSSLQNPQATRSTKVMGIEISAGGDKERAADCKLVCRCMRPWHLWLGHKLEYSECLALRNNTSASTGRRKAVGDYRSPGRFALTKAGPKLGQVLEGASPLGV